jgi:hypothetical protein
MLFEAAAQCGAVFRQREDEEGFLVSLKGIKLLNQPTSLEYVVSLVDEYKMENMRYASFEIFQDDTLIAKGTYVLAVK